MAYLSQFEEFWQILLSEGFEMPDEAKSAMFTAWSKIKWPTSTTQNEPKTRVTKAARAPTGKLNGYNLYMREKLIELKKDGELTGTARMKKVAEMWKEISPEEKAEWTAKAKALQPEVTSRPETTVVSEVEEGTTKTKREPTSYNKFVKAKMSEVKASGIEASQRMGKISEMWKALSQEEKNNWK